MSQTGTKEAQECSGRGYCNRQTGHCTCYSKFGSSDGKGAEGDRGDCGYYDPYDPPTNCSTVTPLWGSTAALCSGKFLLVEGRRVASAWWENAISSFTQMIPRLIEYYGVRAIATKHWISRLDTHNTVAQTFEHSIRVSAFHCFRFALNNELVGYAVEHRT